MKVKFLAAFSILLLGISFNFSDPTPTVTLGSTAYAHNISQYQEGYGAGRTAAKMRWPYGSNSRYDTHTLEWKLGYDEGYKSYYRRP